MASFPSRNIPNGEPILPTSTTPSVSTPTHALLVMQILIRVNINDEILNATQYSNEIAPTANQHHPGE